MRFPLPRINESGHGMPVVEVREIIFLVCVWKMFHQKLAPRGIFLFDLHVGAACVRDISCNFFNHLDKLPTVLPATILLQGGHSNSGFRRVLLYHTRLLTSPSIRPPHRNPIVPRDFLTYGPTEWYLMNLREHPIWMLRYVVKSTLQSCVVCA